MNTEPWIGDPSSGVSLPGTCTFAVDEGQPKCGNPATVHILSESAIHGLVSLPACDRHALIARKAGPYIAEHPYEQACSAELTRFSEECKPVEDIEEPS